jgi:poly(A) polymerase
MSTDPKREFAVAVVRQLRDAGHIALWAGGCVRDLLLGITPKDYDVATDAVPRQVIDTFGRRKTQAVGASFGVILVRGPQDAGTVEVATFRTDGSYVDGRRPESVEFSTPEEDAQRRDFTINGMFYDPIAKQVLDFVGGERDLSSGIIRAIGDPHDRMREDKLRMLRAVRFAATLDFELDGATADAIREMAPEMLVVSAERITQELRRMLTDRHRMRAMKLARDVGILQVILPELRPILGEAGRAGSVSDRRSEVGDQGSESADLRPPSSDLRLLPADGEWDVTLHMLQLLQDPGFELAAAVLLQGIAPDPAAPEVRASTGADDAAVAECAAHIARRFRMANEETDEITWLLAHRHALDDAEALRPSRLKRLLIAPHFGDLLALVRAERLARNIDLRPVLFCEDYLASTPESEINPPELLAGDDLIRLGLQPGPRFKELLTAVRDAQLDGEIAMREEAIELVKRST